MSWLYVPGLVELNLVSNSQIRQPDAFVMLRGKPTQPQSLLNAWKKKPWMKHLSGLTLEPSTVSRGVTRWIASLAAIPASHSVLLDTNLASKTQDTCGQISKVSLEKSSQESVSLK